MRVCIVTTVHNPWDGRIFYREARTLAAEGFEVFILHQSGEPDETRAGVQSVGLPRPRNRLVRAFRARKIVRHALAMSPDVVHIHDLELLAPAARRCKRRTPLIYDVHEDYFGMIDYKEWVPGILRWLVKLWVAFSERRHAKKAYAVVVADRQLAEHFRRFHRRVVVAHNYPPSDVFGSPTAERRDEIVYEGGITPVRGAYVMLDLIERVRERFPNMKLTMIGVVQAEADEINRRVEALGADAATIEPPVDYEELPARIAGAKLGLALLQPCRKFLANIPTKVFDYMAADVPYVASDFPHLARLVGEVGGKLADPQDVQAAAETVIGLLENETVRGAIGERGRWAFERRYSWERASRRLVKLYREIEERDGRRQAASGRSDEGDPGR